jgi:hypothetical protein
MQMEQFFLQNNRLWSIGNISPDPISESEPDSPENFLRSVQETIASEGCWRASTEYRMGGGTTVTITRKSAPGVQSWMATATWGSLVSCGEYESLELALRALPLISAGLLLMREEGAWKGLVGG